MLYTAWRIDGPRFGYLGPVGDHGTLTEARRAAFRLFPGVQLVVRPGDYQPREGERFDCDDLGRWP